MRSLPKLKVDLESHAVLLAGADAGEGTAEERRASATSE